MGKRFLAVLAVVALGAGSAMVGMTMASGSWEVVGTGLAPGEGYAVKMADGADRLKFELATPTDSPVATFAVFGPNGDRVGYYALDGSNAVAEIVGGPGTWMVFVYKAHGADLTVAVHGTEGAGKFLPADVRRQDLKLAHEQSERAAFEKTYTMVLDEAPVLAGLYLKGSARNLQTELWTEKGVVEVVSEEELAAAGSVIVDSKGARNTFPQNLQEGPFTAKVKADELSGTIQLVALYLDEPDFAILEEVEVESEPGEEAPKPDAKKHRHAHPRAPPKAPAPPAMEAAECGEAESRVPYALEVPHRAMLQLTLEHTVDPPVTVFDPMDQVLAVVNLEEEGQVEQVPLREAGEYVLYARGAVVKVEVLGVAECELRALDMEGVLVATVSGEGLLGPTSAEAAFFAGMPPLEFGMHLGGERVTSAAMNVRALFTGPDGEAGAAYQSFSLGLTGGSGFFPWWGNQGHPDGIAEVDAGKMLQGDWMVQVDADTLQGDLDIYALHYLREAAEDEDEH